MKSQEQPTRYGRHGDLVIDRIPVLPSNLRPDPSKILASGDSGGQPHRIGSGARILRPEQPSRDGLLFVEICEPDNVVHDRHGPMALAVGSVRVVPKRMWVLGGQETVRD